MSARPELGMNGLARLSNLADKIIFMVYIKLLVSYIYIIKIIT